MIMQQPTADSTDMSWALNRLCEEPGVLNALLFTSDGLVMAHSHGLDRDDADRTAATLAGLNSLQRDLGGFCRTQGRQHAPGPLRFMVSDLKTVTLLLFVATERTGVGVSVRGESASHEVSVAIQATLKMINGLRPVLGARERGDTT
ncbi:roadblock/LC7 domain-containing protein [Nonomuraea fuscirosea]|jgi:hypothetical protein|nr:roadblock/LC7 domain-containing protein [Nonomuraea fuscirosea]WSA57174.1 roadblock/LC7 domain-containing protein [Nonomuraea fuscirosea]